MIRRQFLATVAAAGTLSAVAAGASWSAAAAPFLQRGCYLLPCRAPTLGYEAYRGLVDALAGDRVNTVKGCPPIHGKTGPF